MKRELQVKLSILQLYYDVKIISEDFLEIYGALINRETKKVDIEIKSSDFETLVNKLYDLGMENKQF